VKDERVRDDRTAFDRLAALFEDRPLPWWLLLVILYVVLAAIMTAAFWIDGSAPAGVLGRPALDAFYAPFGLFILLSVRRHAHLALDRFEPALRGLTDDAIDRFRRRLTGLSNRHMALGLGIGLVIGAMDLFPQLDAGTGVVGTTLLSTTVAVVIGTVLGYGLGITGVVYAITVLATIPDVHRAATTIDVRRPDPAHAFAPLTAHVGVLLLLLVTFSAITDPATFESVSLALAIVIIVVAIVAFLAPLVGMRGRLHRHKAVLLDEAATRIEALEAELERTVDASAHERIRPLVDALGAFVARRDRIAGLSTMPWDIATLRGFSTALLIPVTTWLVTSVLGRTLFS